MDAFFFDKNLIRRILEASEGAVITLQGRGAPRTVSGHTGERHSGITNAALSDRGGDTFLPTAFLDFRQAVEIAELVFNTLGQQAIEAIRGAKAGTPQSKREFQAVEIGQKREVRLANHRGTLLCSRFTIVLAKNVDMPANLMVVTFFPTGCFMEIKPAGHGSEMAARASR